MAGTGAGLSPRRVWAARALAILVDGLQIITVPAFFGGLVSPLNDALDLAAGVVFILLLGWHVAFLPTFVTELIPVVDIFPTWTAAVLFVTYRKTKSQGS
jgi:hypothetical protein